MRTKIAIAAGIIILLLVNWSIMRKESQLANGTLVYLELAPVDPRSLIQGDYMALRFQIANDIRKALGNQQKEREQSVDGMVVVTLDQQHRASFARLANELPLAESELALQYRIRDDRVKFASNAFFFQEGKAQLYDDARYGEFRVNDSGGLLLTGLCDRDLNKLGNNINDE